MTPQEVWQKKEMKNKIHKTIKSIISEKRFNFLNYKELEDIYSKYQTNEFKDWAFIWRLFCLNEFIRVWKLDVS